MGNGKSLDSPTAYYTYSLTPQPDSSILISFQNKSINATSYKWYFSTGDSSISFEPTLKIFKNSTYNVILKAINAKNTHLYSSAITISNLDTAKNPNNYPRPTADFKVLFNIDSSNIVSFTNLSVGYTKVLWKFEDNETSSDINPIHHFSTSNKRTVKLIVENIYKNKDSITVEFHADFGKNQLGYQYLITNVNPISYLFYLQFYYSPYQKFGISFGDNFTSNPTYISKEYIRTFTTSDIPDTRIHYYTDGRITTYKKINDLNLYNIASILDKVIGEYYFLDRSTYSSYTTDSTIYNDTTLSIRLIGDAIIELKDTKLNHTFTGYLSSTSTTDYYEFRLVPNPVTGSIYEVKYMQFPKKSNSVIAYQRNTFGMLGNYSETIYRGTK